jgi:YHS domain-containing protein
MARDPVCGMPIDCEKVAASLEYHGVTYYFCAKGCSAEFEQQPAKFLAETRV